jgi:hypothetical protein
MYFLWAFPEAGTALPSLFGVALFASSPAIARIHGASGFSLQSLTRALKFVSVLHQYYSLIREGE